MGKRGKAQALAGETTEVDRQSNLSRETLLFIHHADTDNFRPVDTTLSGSACSAGHPRGLVVGELPERLCLGLGEADVGPPFVRPGQSGARVVHVQRYTGLRTDRLLC